MATALNSAAEGKINLKRNFHFKVTHTLSKECTTYAHTHVCVCVCVWSSTKAVLSHNYPDVSSPYPKYNSSFKAHMKTTNNSSNILFLPST